MKSAVTGIAVFEFAARTHRKASHGSVRAIVGKRLQDAVAGPAVRAVNKGIAEATVIRIEELPEAILASAEVRQDRDRRSPVLMTGGTNQMGEVFDGIWRRDPRTRVWSLIGRSE